MIEAKVIHKSSLSVWQKGKIRSRVISAVTWATQKTLLRALRTLCSLFPLVLHLVISSYTSSAFSWPWLQQHLEHAHGIKYLISSKEECRASLKKNIAFDCKLTHPHPQTNTSDCYHWQHLHTLTVVPMQFTNSFKLSLFTLVEENKRKQTMPT